MLFYLFIIFTYLKLFINIYFFYFLSLYKLCLCAKRDVPDQLAHLQNTGFGTATFRRYCSRFRTAAHCITFLLLFQLYFYIFIYPPPPANHHVCLWGYTVFTLFISCCFFFFFFFFCFFCCCFFFFFFFVFCLFVFCFFFCFFFFLLILLNILRRQSLPCVVYQTGTAYWHFLLSLIQM